MNFILIFIAGVIWALSVLGFLYASALSIPSYTVPLALLCFMILFLLNPTRTFHHEARFWLLKKLVSLLNFIIVVCIVWYGTFMKYCKSVSKAPKLCFCPVQYCSCVRHDINQDGVTFICYQYEPKIATCQLVGHTKTVVQVEVLVMGVLKVSMTSAVGYCLI